MVALPRWKVVGLGIAAVLFAAGSFLSVVEEPALEGTAHVAAPPSACDAAEAAPEAAGEACASTTASDAGT